MNPSSWWENVSTRVPVNYTEIVGAGSTMLDVTDVSMDATGPDTFSVLLPSGQVHVSNLSMFSDVVLNDTEDLQNYLAWIQATNDAQVIYRNVTMWTPVGANVSTLYESLATRGTVTVRDDTLRVVDVAVDGIVLQDCEIAVMAAANVESFQDLKEALRDNSVNFIEITSDIDEGDGPHFATVVQRPIIITSKGHTWRQTQHAQPTFTLSFNGSLNLQGDLTLIQAPGTQPLYQTLPTACVTNETVCSSYTNTNATGVIRLKNLTVIGRPKLSAVATFNRLACKPGDVVYNLPSADKLIIVKWQINGGIHPTCFPSNTYIRVLNTTQQTEPSSGRPSSTLIVALAVALPLLFVVCLVACATMGCCCWKRKTVKSTQHTSSIMQKLTAVATRVLGVETLVLELLGTGSYANVYKAQYGSTIVALKVTFPIMSMDHNVEAHLGQSLQHPNIVNTLRSAHRMVDPKKADEPLELRKWPSSQLTMSGSPSRTSIDVENRKDFLRENWLILEYCDKKSIKYGLVHNTFDKSWINILLTLRDVVYALKYMHDHNVTHGDLNTNNIMLKSDPQDPRGFVAKVADFGLAQSMFSWQQKTKVTMSFGTVTHQPPELLQRGELSQQTDIYALGIVMYELYTGEQPYKNEKQGAIINKVSKFNLRPVFPSGTPEEYRLLAQQCWHARATERPGIMQIQSSLMPLLKNFVPRKKITL
jgi:hypothetical protein